MAKPWVESPSLPCDLDSAGLGINAEDVVSLVPHATAMLDDLRSQIGDVDVSLAEMIDTSTEGRFRTEAETWASLLGRTWQEILLANCAYDAAVRVFMCSGVAAESENGPVLARNVDWWPEHALALGSVLLDYRQGSDRRFQIAGWAGSIGAVSGMSSRGFALAMNAVLCQDAVDLAGYPVMLFLRYVLETAGSFDDAFEMICRTELASPCLVLLVGLQNSERVVIERTPARHAVRRGSPGTALVVTNDYRVLDDSADGVVADAHGLHGSACGRYDGLSSQFESGRIDSNIDDAMLFALSDPAVRM